MQVVDDNRRHHGEQALEGLDSLGERAERREVLQVSDVVADPGAFTPGEAEGVLELGPAGQQRRRRAAGKRERRGHEAARAPQEGGSCASADLDGAHHRIVGARLDRPVVEQEQVGEAGEAFERVAVLVGDRLVGDVAAGQHQCRGDVERQQVVKGRVRQHHAELARPRGDRLGDRGVAPAGGEHDRARRCRHQGFRLLAEHHQRPRLRDRGGHQGERLVLAVLAVAQPRDRKLDVGAAGEVEPADSLDGHDPPVAQRGGGPRERLGVRRHGDPGGVRERQRRPAGGAGVRLRVKASVARIVVLRAAALAHHERRHRRQRPVVGDAAHDREAGAAVGAVDERVAKAPVGRVEELGQAVLARRRVRRHGCVGELPAGARDDLEADRAVCL